MEKIIVPDNDAGMRLDLFLSMRTDLSRSGASILIKNELVKVNGNKILKKYILKPGDEVTYEKPKPVPSEIVPEDIPLDIIYEDPYLLVVNKPAGMVVHPSAGNNSKTLVNALMSHCKGTLSGINGVIRPGIVHRLDKDTSGLLIVAKTDEAHIGLAKQIKEHSFLRIYNAIVLGKYKEKTGEINLPIGRDPKNRKRMAVTEKNSRNALTLYRVLEEYSGYSLVEFELKTGRTHQIRVHSAYMGHPVAGDPVYLPQKMRKNAGGQYLHAKKIGFIHPISLQYLEFDSQLPERFFSFISKIRNI